MTQPQDPRNTPLQDDEIALARVLRALPAGEPSAKVDAAILAAATDAVNGAASPAAPASRRAARASRWLLPGWAIGTAAAAVLAVGIGMQLRPPLAPEPQATSAEAAREAPPARDAVDIELVEPQPRTLPATPPPPPESSPGVSDRAASPLPPPPPPPPPAQPQAVPPAPVAEAAEAFPMEAASEPAPAPERESLDSITVSGTRVSPPPESGDHARRAHQAAYATRAQREAAAKAEARTTRTESEAEALEELRRERQARSAEDAAPVVAEPAPAPAAAADAATAGNAAAILPPVAADASLPPREWLERIRERLRQGDRAGARASLLLFAQTHPDAPIPTDLDRLR